MAPPRLLSRRWAASLCAAVLALCTPPCGTVKARAKASSRSVGGRGERRAAKTGPEAVGKVLELVADLMVKIDRDATIDAKGFEEYNAWYQNISMNTKRVIDETSEQIDSLKAGLEEQEAFRDGAQRDLEEAGNKRGAVEKELTDTTEKRKNERKEFEKTEATLAEGADQLERSLVVLGREMPPQGAGGSASLLTVAEGLRKTLESGPDFDLSAGQRQTLHAFLRAANAKAHHQGDAADFLQVQQQQVPQVQQQYGDYESQSGGVVATLESVLEKTKTQLDEARDEETKAADTFTKYEADLKAEISNHRRTMAELNTQLSQSQESSGQMQSQLIAATELLKVSQDQLKEIEAEFSEKNRNYKDRVAKRSDELMALTEAKEILSSEAMSQSLDAAAQAPEKASDAATGADSFLQLSPRLPALCARGYKLARQAAELAARRWDQPTEDAAPALSLVALRTRSRVREADPFDKVKDMIGGMLAKLQDQQNEEAKHKEWCDREMSKSVQSEKEKQDNIRKLTDRIAAMDAELAQVTDGISVVTEDLAEMSASIKSATELRTDEHNAADVAITQSRDAQRLIQAAIKVLKRVYKDTDAGVAQGAAPSPSPQEASSPEGQVSTAGWGPGVIGILEVALQDYADLEKEVSIQESVSNKEYKEMMDQSEIRQATFGKDLEYKGRAKVKLEGDRMRASTDLKGYEKELEAVQTYLKELQSSCVARPSSYEERAARRESELKSLKEALDFLNGEGLA